MFNLVAYVKFIYSEKASKFEEISLLLFVAFSEFKTWWVK